ncbi:SDR family oxidoreductase [Deminuibacter soli]|uniref:SDR family NAD(P)-dependent oxidoreductase n=1 Tax=Deminuibacter soli TaxID=2291815 RepID=A0A3E1NI28_9BACT|nr:SDR family oxidoreductase [Deminuibacter soli]RFM27596.1 SDR family NAD(P)-dependent oxidoreductase [Deminuibacter soli]
MNLDLTGKTALVGGASQGLGAAVATELAGLGASVIVWARNEDKLKNVVASLPLSKGQRHRYLVADSNEPAMLLQQIKALQQQGVQIQLLVNNTGGPPAGLLIDTDVTALETAFRAHLVTAHLLVQCLLEDMKTAGYGRIVNITSTSVKEPIDQLGISNSVRAAVSNWAKTLANEIAQYGITVNNVLPGFTATDRIKTLFGKRAESAGTTTAAITAQETARIPARRIGKPEEFAAAVAFLCSPAAAYINGVNLPVDGGRLNGL